MDNLSLNEKKRIFDESTNEILTYQQKKKEQKLLNKKRNKSISKDELKDVKNTDVNKIVLNDQKTRAIKWMRKENKSSSKYEEKEINEESIELEEHKKNLKYKKKKVKKGKQRTDKNDKNNSKNIDTFITKESSGSNNSDREKNIIEQSKISFSNESAKDNKIIISKSFDNKDKDSNNNIIAKLDDMKNYISNEFLKVNNELKNTKAKIKQLQIKFGLSSEINKQIEIYNNKKYTYLNSKMNAVLNSFKVLYFRKLTNLILERIISKYRNNLAKTKKIFGYKPKFSILVAKNDIKQISKYKLNLLFDFLRHIKKISSQMIHFKKVKNIITQKEIFYEILDEYNKDNNAREENGKIKIDDITNILFNSKPEDNKIPEIKESKLHKLFDEFIKKEKRSVEEDGNIGNEKEEELGNDSQDGGEEEGEEEREEEKEVGDLEEGKGGEEKFDENKLKSIIQGDDYGENITITNLLMTLESKLNSNKNIDKKTKFESEEINSDFFYKSWIKSFKTLKYKKQENYKVFVNFESSSLLLENVPKIIKKLLKKEKIEVFDADPENIEDNITEIIEKY
jgi:hypothetical protein